MGKYFGILNGEGLDWKFKRHEHYKGHVHACQFMLKDCKVEDYYKKEDF